MGVPNYRHPLQTSCGGILVRRDLQKLATTVGTATGVHILVVILGQVATDAFERGKPQVLKDHVQKVSKPPKLKTCQNHLHPSPMPG